MKFILLLNGDYEREPDIPGIVISLRNESWMFMCAMINQDCEECGSDYCGQCQDGESPWVMGYETDILQLSGKHGLFLSDVSETIDDDSNCSLPFEGLIKTNTALLVRNHRGKELSTPEMIMGRYEAHSTIYLALRNQIKSDTTPERRK